MANESDLQDEDLNDNNNEEDNTNAIDNSGVIEVDESKQPNDASSSSPQGIVSSISKNPKGQYASINICRPQRTASARTLKIIATEERKGRVQKHTVYVIECDPPPPGVITVARRYNDFKWLRTVLCQEFPGLFVAPLPPASVIGRFENSFVEERRQDLERFLNRIEEVSAFAESMAFGMFLSRPESTFLEGKKEVQSQIDERSDSDIASMLSKLFPDLSDLDIEESVHSEDVPQLQQFLVRVDAQMTAINKSATRLFKHLNFVSSELKSFSDAFDGLYSAESNYPYKASESRLDVRNEFVQWSDFQTSQTDCYYSNFFRQLRYEQEDVRALMELFRSHDLVYKKYQKCIKNLEKWDDLEEKQQTLKPNQERQQEIDKANRKMLMDLLSIITKIILKNEIVIIWNHKTTQWRDKIQEFAKKQADVTNKMIHGWKGVAND